jgi:tetratricopeptide (TPR) repeat protein
LDNYRFGEAETVANNAARLDPDGWMGHAALTTLYSRTARFAKARSELDLMQKAGGKATTDPYFNWIEGNSWYYSTEYPNYGQNYTAAYKFFDRTLLEWPNVPSIVGIRSFLFALSDYKINGAASLTKIEDMTKIQPKSSRLFSYLAHMNLFFESNDIKAERYAQAALEVNEANPQARLVLGGLEGRTKNYTVSYDYYERCVATDPYQDQCYADWANFLADNALENEVVGKTSEAQRLREIGLDKAKKAVGIAPTHYFWIYRLGYFYTLLRDYKNGVEQLEKAVAIRQDVAVTYGLLGLAYYGNGQRDKAQTAYDTGNKLDPTDFWVRRLGDTLAVK